MTFPLVRSVYVVVELERRLFESVTWSGTVLAVTVIKPNGVVTVVGGRSAGTQMPVSPPPVPAPGQNTHRSPIKEGSNGGLAPCVGRPHPPNSHLRFSIPGCDQVTPKSLPPGVFRSAAGDGGGGRLERP